ncbi:uncharacterized protein Dsimw501_GD26900, isoform A [Drosophila simulans]|uniref:Uncharacterized protein, isoform A n=1 Tax=Drosophila simulans TaxID=7240 RepID=A0A0J9RUY2_DROSI|nr:uncharacterized protein Dsimw501_GD26900, isoform A [Drosophila simulans]
MDYKKLKKMEEEVRIGGKGSMRRKHKRIPSAEDGSDPDNDKVQSVKSVITVSPSRIPTVLELPHG